MGSKENVVLLWHVKSSPPLGPVCVLGAITPKSHPLQSPSLTLLGYVQKQMPADELGSTVTQGTCLNLLRLWPGGVRRLGQLSAGRWWMLGGNILGVWAMSFSLKSSGTLLDPRHKAAAALKIKVHMCLCAHTSRDKGVRYHGPSSDVSACVRGYKRKHAAWTGCSHNNQPPVVTVGFISWPISSPINQCSALHLSWVLSLKDIFIPRGPRIIRKPGRKFQFNLVTMATLSVFKVWLRRHFEGYEWLIKEKIERDCGREE